MASFDDLRTSVSESSIIFFLPYEEMESRLEVFHDKLSCALRWKMIVTLQLRVDSGAGSSTFAGKLATHNRFSGDTKARKTRKITIQSGPKYPIHLITAVMACRNGEIGST